MIDLERQAEVGTLRYSLRRSGKFANLATQGPESSCAAAKAPALRTGGRLQRPLLRCNIAGVGAQLSVADENRVGSARALDSGKFPLAKSGRLPTSH